MALPSSRSVPSYQLEPFIVGGSVMFDNLLSCKTHDTISNESTLDFSLSRSDPKVAELVAEAPVVFKGRHYRIRKISEGDTVEVHCERLWYDLLYAGQVSAQAWQATASTIMSTVLAGTGWSVGQVDPTNTLGWQSQEGTLLGMLQQIASIYGGDLVIDDQTKTVNLVDAGGRDRGTSFFYGRDVTGASKVEDTSSLVTRVYGVNAEGVTIAAANGGVPYLEDYSWTTELRSTTYKFSSGMTPQAMKRYLTAFLASRSQPRITYTYKVALIEGREQEVDRFEVLDIVHVVDGNGSIVKNRIVSLDLDWIDLSKSAITLGNQLRTLAKADASTDPNQFTTGVAIDTRDINPFNLLTNSRADNGMAGWSGTNVNVVSGGVTGRYSFKFGPSGGKLSQTVASDNRSAFIFSAQVDVQTSLAVKVTFKYLDGTTETRTLVL